MKTNKQKTVNGKEMIKQTRLSFKLGITEEEITPRSGLSVYAEFLRRFGIKELIDRHMPLPGTNRGYWDWQYIEPIMMMLYGSGRYTDDLLSPVNHLCVKWTIMPHRFLKSFMLFF